MSSRSSLVNRSGLHQLEETDFGFEFGPVGALHFVAASHGAEGRRERAAGGVFKSLPGFEHGLFSDDAGAVDFFCMPRRVDDRPMPILQLDGCLAFVRDSNRVEEEPPTRGGCAVFFGMAGANDDSHVLGEGFRAGFEGVVVIHDSNLSSRASDGSRVS